MRRGGFVEDKLVGDAVADGEGVLVELEMEV